MKPFRSAPLRWLTALLAVVCLQGCLEEQVRMVILPDGAGRLDIEVKFGKKHSESIVTEVGKGTLLVDECRRRIGGQWKGIAFWTDEVAGEKPAENGKENLVHYRGSAWFPDIAKVNLTGQQWIWKPPASGGDGDSLFEFAFDPLPKPDAGQTRLEQVEKLREILEGFDVSFQIQLPGNATIESGRGVAEGREVSYRLTADDLFAGARLEKDQRSARYHRLVVRSAPATAKAKVEQDAFHKIWPAMEQVGVLHQQAAAAHAPQDPAPPPLPLDPPLTLREVDAFYPVPDSAPDWKLEKSPHDELSEWWHGSIRGSRDERIPIIIRVPRQGRPCPVAVFQNAWHGSKESGQNSGAPVLVRGVAVVSFDGPLAGSRTVEGRDPLGDSLQVASDNHRWAVADLRTVIRALRDAPLPPDLVTMDKGVVLVGVSLGGPTASTAFALEETVAAAATVVAGAGAWSAARDADPPGFSLEGAKDMRLRTTAEAQREAALLDPAMILPLVRPRPIAIIGGEDDGYAPPASLQRLARAADKWPDVFLRVHPDVGHFISEAQQKELHNWIVARADELR